MSDPTRTLASQPTRRLPVGMLGMLALVVAVEMGISARRLDFTTVWADDWRCAARAATRQAKGRDVLCLGDSLVKFGVLPKVIEAKTGLKAYNLAVNAGTVPATYLLLKRALDSGAKPRALLVDFFALMQPEVPRNQIRLYPDLASFAECFDLAKRAGDPDFFHATMMGKLLPSYKCRFEIRESIKGALEGRRASPWPEQADIWASWKTQDGAQPMPFHPVRPPAHPVLVSDISPVDWKCDAVNATYVEKFLKLAGSHQIPVFWLILPVSPEVQFARDFRRSDDAYDRFARETLGRHPEVVVLDARRSRPDGADFFDPIHLNVRGATALTDALASKVADRLNGRHHHERWVAVSPFDVRSEGIAQAGGGSQAR